MEPAVTDQGKDGQRLLIIDFKICSAINYSRNDQDSLVAKH